MPSTATISVGVMLPARAKKRCTSGRSPACQRCSNRRASGRSAPGTVSIGLRSITVVLLQAQFPSDAADGAVQLDPAAVGRAAHLGRDVGPGVAGGAQVCQPSLLFAQPPAELAQQLLCRDQFARAGPGGPQSLRVERLEFAGITLLGPGVLGPGGQLVARDADQ